MNLTAMTFIGENVTTTVGYQNPFDDSATIASGVVILFFLVVGISLNTLTIVVIVKTSDLRNIFMDFIVSLCVSDLMSAFISPLFWYRRTLGVDVWMPPSFFCKLYWAVDLMTSFSTSMHILNFTILRYISIQHSRLFRKISDKAGKIWIAATWCIAFLCGFVPLFALTGADSGVKRDRTSEKRNAEWPACTILLETVDHYERFSWTAYSIFLFLPMIAVIIVSMFIGRSVHQHTKTSMVSDEITIRKRVRKEKQAVLQLVLIAVSFILGYVPFVTYEIWSLTPVSPIDDYRFGLGQYFCLRLSECLNPIFYNIGSSKMRRHTKMYLRKMFKCCPTCMQNAIGQPSPATSVTTTRDGGPLGV